jgi:hypothetical protein
MLQQQKKINSINIIKFQNIFTSNNPHILQNKKHFNFKDNYFYYYFHIFRIYCFSFIYFKIFKNELKFNNLQFIEKELEIYNKNNNLDDFQKVKIVKNIVTNLISYDTICLTKAKDKPFVEPEYSSVFILPILKNIHFCMKMYIFAIAFNLIECDCFYIFKRFTLENIKISPIFSVENYTISYEIV